MFVENLASEQWRELRGLVVKVRESSSFQIQNSSFQIQNSSFLMQKLIILNAKFIVLNAKLMICAVWS